MNRWLDAAEDLRNGWPVVRGTLRVALLCVIPAASGCAPAAPAGAVPTVAVAPVPSAEAAAQAPVAVKDKDEDADLIPVSADDPQRGDETALVAVVLFGDVTNSWSTFLLDQYEEHTQGFPVGTVRLVWKHYIEVDDPAARQVAERIAIASAAVHLAAGSKAFFAFQQAVKDEREPTGEELEQLAVAAGASADRYRASLGAAKAKVAADQALMKHLPYPGYWYYVNGRSCSVRFSCDVEATIQEELDRGRTLLDEATPPARVIALRVRENVKGNAHCVLLSE